MDRETEMPPLPEGMPCPGCGYDVGGIASWVCPECGRMVSGDDVLDFTVWREAGTACRRIVGRTLVAAVAAVVAMTALAWVVSGSAFHVIAVACGASGSVGAVFGLARLLGRGAPALQRRAVEAAFIAAGRWLLLPWVVTLPGACVFAALGLAGRVIGIDSGLVGASLVLALIVWLTASLAASPELFFTSMKTQAEALRAGPPRSAVVLAFVLVWVPGLVIGGVGLALALELGAMVGTAARH